MRRAASTCPEKAKEAARIAGTEQVNHGAAVNKAEAAPKRPRK